ncbi:MAG: thermonuclease family protein [bacterium]|nr:thermonuclease family protein [bacterium]
MRRFLLFALFLSLTLLAFFLGRLTIHRQPSPIQTTTNAVASPHPSLTSSSSLNVSFEPSLQTTVVRRVIDGDTVELEGGGRVRLIGIDTPEVGDCYATEATLYLRSLIEGKSVALEKDVSETDRYHRLLRYIWIDDVFVNEQLVQGGFAHSSTFPPDVKYQQRFIEAERQSRGAKEGLWLACTDVKGVTTTKTPIPIPIQSNPTIASDSDCTIKGNISKSGEKIYHLPGQRYYNQTQIDESKGEKWFCSESDASSAGWRRSKI